MTLYIYKDNSGNYTKIAIDSEKVDELFGNQTIITPIPKGKDGQSPSFNPVTYIIDLKKMSHKVSIQGYISNQSAVINSANINTTTSITATEAKNYLKKYILNGQGTTRLYWRGAAVDFTVSNPTTVPITGRYYEGEISSFKVTDSVMRMDMTQDEYEAIKGAYGAGYPGDVKRYQVNLDFVVGTKR